MNKTIFNILMLLFFSASVPCMAEKSNYRIEFEVEDYEEDQLLIGYYYADKTLIKDTLHRNVDNFFILEGQDTLKTGVYLALTFPDNNFFQFFVSEEERHFKVKVNANEINQPQFKNAKDNEIFYSYLAFLREMRPKVENINKEKEVFKDDESKLLTLQENLDKINAEVKAYQLKVVSDHPQSLSSLMIRANVNPEIPEFEGSDDSVQIHRYLWFKEHYFDNFDLANPVSLFTPLIHQRVNYYIEKLTPLHPDSLIKSIDFILQKTKPAEETYRYYLSHFLNTYAKSKYVGFDAVYVHIAENYYAKGETPWVSEENLKKIVDNAKRLKPLLIGKIAPDFTVYKEDNTAITLSQIDAEYIVLVFWAPDCGHCEKALPHILEFEKNYKDKGVQLLSICNRTGKKYSECWESVKEKGMESLLNVGDQYHRSRIFANYYVKTTPSIYVLNKDREILLKKIAAEKLGESMDEIFKMNGRLIN